MNFLLNDILRAYNISRATLKDMILAGKIKAEKIFWDRKGTKYMYVIPETELVKLEHLKKSEPIPSDEAQPGYYEARYRAHDTVDTILVDNFNCEAGREQRKRRYLEYMCSEDWKKLRRQRMLMDGDICQHCGTGKNLQVHHLTYRHLGQPEEIDDLRTLCQECHRKIHSKDICESRLTKPHEQKK